MIIIVLIITKKMFKYLTQCEASSKEDFFPSLFSFSFRFLQGIFSLLSECEVLPSNLLTEFWKIGQEVLITGDI